MVTPFAEICCAWKLAGYGWTFATAGSDNKASAAPSMITIFRSMSAPDAKSDSSGVDQNNFSVLDPDDLDCRKIGDRGAVPRVDAHSADFNRASGGHQIGVPTGIQV